MRLLQLFEPRDGGIPDHVRRLGVGLAERGHEITACGPPDAACRDALEAAGVRYEPLPWSATVPDPRSDIPVSRGLKRILDHGTFDLVHTHGQKAGLQGRPPAHRRGLPVLYTPHCFVHRSQAARDRRSSDVRAEIGRRVEAVLGRRTALIVAVSRDEANAAIDDGIAPPSRVTVIEHGLEPDLNATPDPELMSFRGEGPLFGFLAGLRPQKGLPDLLDALAILAAEGRAPRVAIVGNGPEEELVKQRLATEPIGTTTKLVPFRGRVEPYLEAFDVYVLPSLWEGMPIGAVEALMLGVPVIASTVGGSPEAVEEGTTGLLVPPRDPERLAKAIARLNEDHELRQRMGAAAPGRTRERFALPRMIDDLESAYERVVAGTARSL